MAGNTPLKIGKIFVLAVLFAVSISARFVTTPFGVRPSHCVHQVPSGSTIQPTDGGVLVAHSNGTSTFLPELSDCVEFQQKYLNLRWGDGWLDNVGFYPPKEAANFTGTYILPDSSPSQPSGQYLYYFIGIENINQDDVTILQPVLAWEDGGWTFTSWNCCPSGQVHNSDPITGIPNGAKAFGGIYATENNCTVVSEWNGQTTSLNVVNDDRYWSWADVTLETYYVESCEQFATGPFMFENMVMTMSNGTTVVPDWTTTLPEPSECNGNITVNAPNSVTITHN